MVDLASPLSLAVALHLQHDSGSRPCSPRRRLSAARAKDLELSRDATPRLSLSPDALRKLHISMPTRADEKPLVLSARETSECFVSQMLSQFSAT
ncbi:hypothetical protein SPRG_02765 [Saprolegnia parasitica CBS 223.65]|uniref:Uncharacterized protein n=1 Tax=Saprolegnia parasitica (strain CBS 223.65) TaxID=695850 RepID=A0A067D0K4_SAPPC|nr:hypothetical protein SPRG_02765 [Saprolegnia parasitica CBS 223.65]KDO32286.1 hypothetical protein SPRG_02765 [Saprolegnia parasitica CBS 223.65]|eukprot:XP_012196742.1 hypothetical protein SPRG_02765 [Saprolegnia parasitica CBS 223.65]